MPKTHSAAWLLLSWMALGCGQPDISMGAPGTTAQPVVGGHLATPAELRATVAILWDDALTCTGSLLAPGLVLTAAHCVQLGANPAAHLKVLANTLTVAGSAASDAHAVQSVVAHPGYPSAGPWDAEGLGEDHDLALLLLGSNITTQQPVGIFPLAQLDVAVPATTPVFIEGYGEDGAGNQGRLMAATTPMVRHNATEFIAGVTGQPDTCQGDSGGPVYASLGGQLLLLGNTSRGLSSGVTLCGDGGIYTLVPAYVDWITQNSNGRYGAGTSSSGMAASASSGASASGGTASATSAASGSGTTAASYVAPYDGNGTGGSYTPGPTDPIGILRASVGCCCASTRAPPALAPLMLAAWWVLRRRNR